VGKGGGNRVTDKHWDDKKTYNRTGQEGALDCQISREGRKKSVRKIQKVGGGTGKGARSAAEVIRTRVVNTARLKLESGVRISANQLRE